MSDRAGRPRDVVLYDANALNPYGAEVGALLLAAGYRVTRWCRVGDPFAGAAHRSRRVLWASRRQVGVIAAGLSRILGPWAFAAGHLFSRRPLVFLWLLSRQDLRVARVLTRLGRDVVVVDHNPIPERSLPGRSAALMAGLRDGPARVVVHSPHLVTEADGRRERVVPHPSYRRWVGAYRARSVRHHAAPQALFLGALRPDKGAAELPIIVAELLRVDVRVLIAGRGGLPDDAWAACKGHAGFRTMGLTQSLTDHEVAAALRSSHVLLAPYTDVTMSGSILMALSAGLAVAAYESPALRDVLPHEFTVAARDPLALARRAAELAYATESWAAVVDDAMQASDLACMAAWQRVLTADDVAVAAR